MGNNLSIEKIVNNDGDPIQVTGVSSVGACSHRTALTITATPQEITIGANKRTIEIYNNGDATIYYGGSGVASTSGRPILPTGGQIWSQVKSTFSVYLVCATGQTSDCRVIEYS